MRCKSKAGPKRSPKAVRILAIIALVLTFSPIFSVRADEGVSLTDLQSQLANALGINTLSSGILLSVIIMLITLFPTLILTRGKNLTATFMVGMLAMGFCVAIGWLNFAFILFIPLMMALLFSGKARKWLS